MSRTPEAIVSDAPARIVPTRIVPALRPFGHSVYARMTQLAREHGAVDLGQGYPEDEPPAELREVAARALSDTSQQYTPPAGIPELRRAIADKTRRFYGVEVDPDREVVVTAGAEEALTAAFVGLVEPGDEVVVFEPFYIPYLQKAATVGAALRPVPLAPDYHLDEAALRAAVSDATRLILVNSPGNPAGQVLRRDELELIAELAERHDALVLFDDAYEHLCFDGRPHVHGLSIPALRDRALCVSSFGKSFAATGWRVGYAVGPAPLVWSVLVPHQQMSFCGPRALQLAAAHGLALGDDYYRELTARYQRRRDLLCDGLASLGMPVERPEGGFFCALDGRPFGFDDDEALCEALVREAGVAAVPLSASWHQRRGPRHLARLCFAKREETLERALERLARWHRRA